MVSTLFLRILFRTQDLSLVKEYLYRQWKKLIQGKVSVQDFTFAKEVRLGTYRYATAVHLKEGRRGCD